MIQFCVGFRPNYTRVAAAHDVRAAGCRSACRLYPDGIPEPQPATGTIATFSATVQTPLSKGRSALWLEPLYRMHERIFSSRGGCTMLLLRRGEIRRGTKITQWCRSALPTNRKLT